jgi:hypothetical protein
MARLRREAADHEDTDTDADGGGESGFGVGEGAVEGRGRGGVDSHTLNHAITADSDIQGLAADLVGLRVRHTARYASTRAFRHTHAKTSHTQTHILIHTFRLTLTHTNTYTHKTTITHMPTPPHTEASGGVTAAISRRLDRRPF